MVNESAFEIDVTRLSSACGHPTHDRDAVVVEEPVTIAIDGVGSYTLMCTPSDVRSLAVGFAFTEGIISGARDIDLLHHCDDDPQAVRMRLRTVPEMQPERNLIMTSSCGLCGSANIEETITALPRARDSLHVSPQLIQDVLSDMKIRQQTFDRTGAAHAAAIFDTDGRILTFAEDIGRHNALDKVIGKCLLQEIPMEGTGVGLSGRVSLEMVVKAARARIEMMAAVSAPSSLAVEAARACGITLCGFVRDDRATVYSHESRIAS